MKVLDKYINELSLTAKSVIALLLFAILALDQIEAQPSEDYYSSKDFLAVQKVDVHVHIRTQRDAFVRQADKDNFQLVNIAVDGGGTWKGVRDQWKYIKFQQEVFPERYKTITAFSVENFHDANWHNQTIDWLDSCFAQGAAGVKIWKNIGMVLLDPDSTNVMLDDQRFDLIFQHIIDQGKLVFGHLGEPLNCWLPLEEMTTNNDRSYFEDNPQYHMFQHPDLPSYRDQMNARNQRLDRHPDLTFVGAHMASIEWNVDTLAAWFERYPKATIDLAARMGQVFHQTIEEREKVRDFFIKYANRIMYATDLGDRMANTPEILGENLHQVWMRDWRYFTSAEAMESDLVNETFQGIQLPREAVDQIFYGTANRVFKFSE